MAEVVAIYELPTFFEQARAGTLTAPQLRRLEVLVAPTAAGSSLAILDAVGAVVLEGRSVTVVGGVAQAQILADDFESLEAGAKLREVWRLVVDGVVETIERPAYLCRIAPRATLSERMLLSRHPSWAVQRPVGMPSLAEVISTAWSELIRDLEAIGILPGRVLEPHQLLDIHRLKVEALYFRHLAEGGTAVVAYEKAADRTEKAFEKAWDKLTVTLDTDGDGVADTGGRVAVEPELFATNVPWGAR